MLDSSPVALPPVRKLLKRSASTASLASMPTPPRTHRKHARGLSRGSCDSDSEANALISSDDDVPDAHQGKKRRTNDAIPVDEEAFWLGGSSADADIATAGSSRTLRSQAAPLLYRKKTVLQAGEVAPVSPPPSNRKVAVATSHKANTVSKVALSPPRTPRTRSVTKRALRDTLTNPFVATPEKDVEDNATPSPSDIAGPSPHTPNNEEKPYMLWVFRGQRRLYQNPLYDHANKRPYSPSPASELPIDHPDYSPSIHCPPKLLFPEARRNAKGKNATPTTPTKKSRRVRSPSLSGDELGAEDLLPQKLDFGGLEMKITNNNNKRTGKRTLAQEVKSEDPFSF